MAQLASVCGMALVLLVGCHDSTGPTTPVGTFTLATVNTKALPATMYADTGYTVEVTAGSITVTADKKYAGSVTVRETVDGKASIYVDHPAGSWTQAGNAITLTPTGGAAQSGTWSATSLTVTTSDGVFAYSRAP